MPETHTFEAAVEVDEDAEARWSKHVLWIPTHIYADLTSDGDRRFQGTIGPTTFRRAFHKADNGQPYLSFGKAWLRRSEIEVGVTYSISIEVDPDPDYVDVPEELEAALEFDPDAQAAWNEMTPGRRRTLAYSVSRGKHPDTRARRALKVTDELAEAYRTR